MTDYPFEGQLIADPVTFQRATNAKIAVYDAADTTNTTPLALKDASGLPLANPLTSSADAFTQPFYASVADVKMVGAGLSVFISSAVGLRNAAQTAATAAQQSATSASTAAADRVTTAAVTNGRLILTKAGGGTIDAGPTLGPAGPQGPKGLDGTNGKDGLNGSNVLPTDDAIKQAINDTASATRGALNATIDNKVLPKLDKTEAATTYATKGDLSSAGLPKWKANTAYAASDAVLSPNGDIVTAKVAFTSGATYSAANWNLSTTFATPAAVPPLVASALATDPTPANAAAAAVTTALGAAGVGQAVDMPAGADVAGGLTDGSEKRNFVQWKTDGTPSAEGQALMASAIRSEAGINLPLVDLRNTAGGWSSEDGREVFWFKTDAEFTDYTRRKVTNALMYPKSYIAIWADSYGYGWLTGPLGLDTKTGLPTRIWAEGGQTSRRIAARQGAVRALLTLTGNQVPGSGAVTVTAWTANPVMGSANGPRLGYIGGVKGNLTYAPDGVTPTDDTIGTMTFTRIDTGSAVTVTAPVEFISVEEDDTDGYGIIFAFTNDRLGVPIHQTVHNISAMVQRFESRVKRVLVMGSFPASDMTNGTALRTDFDARRAAVKAANAEYWLDPFIDYFMTDQVFTDMGLTMTANDIADRNSGLVPRQLRGDSIHLTQAAKDRLAIWVAQAFKDRGWITTVL